MDLFTGTILFPGTGADGDDLLATGGTIKAAAELVERLQGEIVGFSFLIELLYLGGRKKLEGYDVLSLVQYES